MYNAKLDEHSERSLQSCLAGVSEDYAEVSHSPLHDMTISTDNKGNPVEV